MNEMPNIKNILIAVLVVVVGGMMVFPDSKVTETVREVTNIGGVSTLDGVDLPYTSIGGYRTYQARIPMNATSSFLAQFANPFNATSSIEDISCEATANGIGVANNLYVSTGTTAYSTSSTALINAFAMGTGQFGFDFKPNDATTTAATAPFGTGSANLLPGRTVAGGSNYFLKPNEFINVKIATTTAGTFSSYITGFCAVKIKKM